MHTPLSPHLHTEECNVIISALLRCHEETSKFRQLFGACNDLDTAMRRCTKAERLARTAKHYQESVKKQAEARERRRRAEAEGKTWQQLLNDS